VKDSSEARVLTYRCCFYYKGGVGLSALALVDAEIDNACKNYKLDVDVNLNDYDNAIIEVLVDYLKSLHYNVSWMGLKKININWSFTSRPN